MFLDFQVVKEMLVSRAIPTLLELMETKDHWESLDGKERPVELAYPEHLVLTYVFFYLHYFLGAVCCSRNISSLEIMNILNQDKSFLYVLYVFNKKVQSEQCLEVFLRF